MSRTPSRARAALRRGLAVALTCACLWAARAGADDSQPLLADVGFAGRLNAELPLATTFRDAHGQDAPLRAALGEGPAILVMAYYRCRNLCSVILANLAAALADADLDPARPVDVIVVSIDPTDDPAIAAHTRTELFAAHGEPRGTRWHFLTGSAAASSAVADAIGFRYRYDARTQQYAHAAGITMLTPDGHALRYLYGVNFTPRDLTLGLVETAAGTLGTTADRLLLLCYHYDPVSGTYGFAISALLRAAGVFTAGLIALGIVLLLRAERRRRSQEDAS